MTPWHLHLAVRQLRRGGIVLHATEGVWGLACDPWNLQAVERLLLCKGRAASKGLILVAERAESFQVELEALDAPSRGRVLESWPGPVTWLLPNQRFPGWITGGRDHVAVRVPGHAGCRTLCRAFGGPLVSTSANRTGHPPARNRLQARAWLRDLHRRPQSRGCEASRIYLLPGETLGRRRPSEIRSLFGQPLRRLR